jgi:hypothetical protein
VHFLVTYVLCFLTSSQHTENPRVRATSHESLECKQGDVCKAAICSYSPTMGMCLSMMTVGNNEREADEVSASSELGTP